MKNITEPESLDAYIPGQADGWYLNFISPLSVAMAYYRGSEPGPRPSTERLATHRVSLSELLH